LISSPPKKTVENLFPCGFHFAGQYKKKMRGSKIGGRAGFVPGREPLPEKVEKVRQFIISRSTAISLLRTRHHLQAARLANPGQPLQVLALSSLIFDALSAHLSSSSSSSSS
jgi:hypothetical protein